MSQEKSDNGQTGTRGSPKKSRFRINVSLWAERLPLLLFVIAVGLAGFTAGTYVMRFQVFPHPTIASTYKAALALYHHITQKTGGNLESEKTVVNVAPDGVEAHRVRFLTAAALTDPVLFWGGAMQFAEYCPGHAGCLAVEYAGRGEVRHAYPYRVEEIEKMAMVPFLFKWLPVPWFRFQNDMYVFSIFRYSNGDILVVFHCRYCFLSRNGISRNGIARIARDGQPVWYQKGNGHHVPHVTDDDVAFVPDTRIVEGPIVVNFMKQQRIILACQRLKHDFIRVVDGDGRLLEEISVLDAIIKSPYVSFLRSKHHCDPLHLNSVHTLGEDALGPNGIGPGDLVVSLKNLNAFGILDRDSHRLKKLVHGGFIGQHHVTHLADSRFLMFDNYGTDGVHGPSRLLMVDVADGTATTIFPNDATPERLRGKFSSIKGSAFVSPDRRRVIVTFPLAGKAVEVRLADGAVLTEFTSLHNVSHFAQFPEERQGNARLQELHGVSYVDRERE